MSSKEILSIFLHVSNFHSRRGKKCETKNDLNKDRRKKKQIFIFKPHSGVVVYVSQIAVSAHKIKENTKIFYDKFIIAWNENENIWTIT